MVLKTEILTERKMCDWLTTYLNISEPFAPISTPGYKLGSVSHTTLTFWRRNYFLILAHPVNKM